MGSDVQGNSKEFEDQASESSRGIPLQDKWLGSGELAGLSEQILIESGEGCVLNRKCQDYNSEDLTMSSDHLNSEKESNMGTSVAALQVMGGSLPGGQSEGTGEQQGVGVAFVSHLDQEKRGETQPGLLSDDVTNDGSQVDATIKQGMYTSKVSDLVSRNQAEKRSTRRELSYAQILRVGIKDLGETFVEAQCLMPEEERKRSEKLKKEAAILVKAEETTIWLRKSFQINNDRYLEAVGKLIGDANITAINTDDRNRIEIMVSELKHADRLVGEGVVIGGEWFKVYRVAEKPVKVSLAGAPPYIPHSTIVEALSQYGSCTTADCEPIHAYTKKQSQKHIVTFRRNVWLRVKKGAPPLPEHIIVYFAGRAYTIRLTDNILKCFECGKVGHVKAKCPDLSPNYEPIPIAKSFPGRKGKDEVRTDEMDDINSWRNVPKAKSFKPTPSSPSYVNTSLKSSMIPAMLASKDNKISHMSPTQKMPDQTYRTRVQEEGEKLTAMVGGEEQTVEIRSKDNGEQGIQRKVKQKRAQSLEKIYVRNYPVINQRRGSLQNQSAADEVQSSCHDISPHTQKERSDDNRQGDVQSQNMDTDLAASLQGLPTASVDPEVSDKNGNTSEEKRAEVDRIGKAERKRVLKIGECFQKALIHKDVEGVWPEDPLLGMSIKVALDVYHRNLPFFRKQRMFEQVGDFLDDVAGKNLMDSSEEALRSSRKRPTPSIGSSEPEEVVDSAGNQKIHIVKNGKRPNKQMSPKKKDGHSGNADEGREKVSIKVKNRQQQSHSGIPKDRVPGPCLGHTGSQEIVKSNGDILE